MTNSQRQAITLLESFELLEVDGNKARAIRLPYKTFNLDLSMRISLGRPKLNALIQKVELYGFGEQLRLQEGS